MSGGSRRHRAAERLPFGDLVLEPLRVEHAAEMVAVLADPSLYVFTGGEPPNIRELTEKYTRQVVGHSPTGSETWLNWIVTDASGRALGYVQATVTVAVTGAVTATVPGARAELAWVIAPAHQGRGIATRAAHAALAWLRAQGISRFVAHIHPGHSASESVARHLGLAPTATVVDGEVRWES